MKLEKRQLARTLSSPDPAVRAWLFHGPDEAGSLALADRIGSRDAERVDLDGSQLRSDPARLADEAASTSLFGTPRWLRVRASGDDVLAAVEALLALPETVNPVAIVAGALKPTSKLLKLALASPHVNAVQSYAPSARDAVPLVQELAEPLGLRVRPDVAQRLFDAAAGDRSVLAQELEKLALYVDASPDNPRDLDGEALTAVGAGEGETSSTVLVDVALTGRLAPAVEELRAIAQAGEDGVPLARATMRRLMQLAALRGEADRSGLQAAMNGAQGKGVFWNDKPAVEAELRRWSSADIARLVDRVTAAQAALLSSGTAGPVLVSQELLTIARAAARGR